VYCTPGFERETFNFKFWTVPFDIGSWIGIAISVLTLVIMLKGEWFQVFAILMRQEYSALKTRKSLIVFIFMSIIFTYGYEGVISSRLIVQPPVIVVNNLKDLLDNNYKIIDAVPDAERKFVEIFKAENIPLERVNSSIVHTGIGQRDAEFLLLSQCNVTKAFDAQWAKFLPIRKEYLNVSCQSVKTTSLPLLELIRTHGFGHYRLMEMVRWLGESGILGMYRGFTNFALLLQGTIELGKLEAATRLKREPLSMNDWRILFIAQAYAILMSLAGISLIFEILCQCGWIRKYMIQRSCYVDSHQTAIRWAEKIHVPTAIILTNSNVPY